MATRLNPLKKYEINEEKQKQHENYTPGMALFAAGVFVMVPFFINWCMDKKSSADDLADDNRDLRSSEDDDSKGSDGNDSGDYDSKGSDGNDGGDEASVVCISTMYTKGGILIHRKNTKTNTLEGEVKRLESTHQSPPRKKTNKNPEETKIASDNILTQEESPPSEPPKKAKKKKAKAKKENQNEVSLLEETQDDSIKKISQQEDKLEEIVKAPLDMLNDENVNRNDASSPLNLPVSPVSQGSTSSITYHESENNKGTDENGNDERPFEKQLPGSNNSNDPLDNLLYEGAL